MDEEIKREIILENYTKPFHKNTDNTDNYIKINTRNSSCIDNLDLYFLIKDDIITDIKFDGEACAISTSATSIMIQSLIGKNINEIKLLIENYEKMINHESYNEELLGDNNVYNEIYKQNNRKTCALLPWKALKEVIIKYGK